MINNSPNKINVKKYISYDLYYETLFNGSPEEIYDNLKKAEKEILDVYSKVNYNKVEFRIEHEFDSVEVRCEGVRLETDVEFDKRQKALENEKIRIEKIKKSAEERAKNKAVNKELKERELYEQLKQKYENNN